MLSTAVDTATIRLHVYQNDVWCARGAAPPKWTGCQWWEYIKHEPHADRVFLMGSAANALLIAWLHKLKTEGKLQSVQVASPLICALQQERRNPVITLNALRQVSLAPSQGGFHETTADDRNSYTLTAMGVLRRSDFIEPTPKVLRWLHVHPAWKAVSFIRHLHPGWCAAVLARIIDPRWYVDLQHPDRGAKLASYMGLDPKTQVGASLDGRPHWRHHDACRLVLCSWKQLEQIPDVLQHAKPDGLRCIADSERAGEAPGDFLWRVWANRLQLHKRLTPHRVAMADLRTSQRFIQFVRHVWLAHLYRNDPRAPATFNAQDFFLHQAEADAFNHHML